MTTNKTTTCSFCQVAGHNIRRCKDDRIENAWEQMYFMGNIITPITGMKNWEDINRFLQEILPWDVTVAVAIQFCYAKIKDKNNKDKILDLIYDSLWRHWSNYWWTHQLQDLFDREVEMLKPKQQWKISTTLLCLETEEELKDPVDCPICLDTCTKLETISTNCNHTFCKDCICSHIDHRKQKPVCPMCRTYITSFEIKDVEIYDELYTKYNKSEKSVIPTSTAIHANELRDNWIQSLRENGFIN
jgi:hypothetical protein